MYMSLYECPRCDSEYSHQSSLSRHIKKEHQLFNYYCVFCNKNFARKDTLKRHNDSVHGANLSWACNICNKTFNRKDNYKRHMGHHQNTPSKFKCKNHSNCNFSTRYRHSLKNHEQICISVSEHISIRGAGYRTNSFRKKRKISNLISAGDDYREVIRKKQCITRRSFNTLKQNGIQYYKNTSVTQKSRAKQK